MKNVLDHSVPFEKYFEEISRIPHGSGNERGVAEYLVKFAQRNGFWVHHDALHNVIIKKPGTPGYENAPPVILQSHTDMVCVKADGVEHNFEKDPLRLVLKDRILWADGTTLGADDIAGVATALAILERRDIAHPPLEAVFTAAEEVGMLGAIGLDYSLLSARRMIGLDSGGESHSSVNAAGGLSFRLRCAAPQHRESCHISTLDISGLLGGHSGSCIDLERANGAVVAARILYALEKAGIHYKISRFHGGTVANAIPGTCTVTFCCNSPVETAGIVARASQKIKKDFAGSDPGLSITLSQSAGHLDVLDADASQKLTRLLLLLPQGRTRKSMDIEGFVTASCNIGLVRTDKEGFHVLLSARAESDSKLEELEERIRLTADLLGLEAETGDRYPCWEYMPDSVMRERAAALMQAEWGVPLRPSFEHGGLECGYFARNLPGIDIYVIGPLGYDVHTPNERLDLDSAQRVCGFLVKYLALLKD